MGAKKQKDSFGDRMKRNYEDRYRLYLTRRVPVKLRLDGKAFHTLTRKCDKPFDSNFMDAMTAAALYTAEQIQGLQAVYVQSDEVTMLLTDFNKLTSDAWFDYNLQKMVSIASGYMSAMFSMTYGKIGVFDCRAWNIPEKEVCNGFIWRQKDWARNSVNMLGQAHFSHKEMMMKSVPDVHEMLHTKGINWADLPDRCKNGTFISRVEGKGLVVWDKCPDFKRERHVIEDLMIPEEV